MHYDLMNGLKLKRIPTKLNRKPSGKSFSLLKKEIDVIPKILISHPFLTSIKTCILILNCVKLEVEKEEFYFTLYKKEKAHQCHFALAFVIPLQALELLIFD